MIRRLIKRIPKVRSILDERDRLQYLNKSLSADVITLQSTARGLEERKKSLEERVDYLTSPLSSEDYRIVSNPAYSISSEDLNANRKSLGRLGVDPKSALWFIPVFNHISYGGIYTILRTVESMASRGLEVTVVLYSGGDESASSYEDVIFDEFPSLESANFKVITFNTYKDDITLLPAADISFCTLWSSAYLLLKYNQTKEKYYFIQDYEPMFYAAGSAYALVESTYRFGFKGIVNTPGLEASIRDQYGMETASFLPTVDSKYYYIDDATKAVDDKVRIFFYARPTKPRNAFALGREVILKLKDKYGDRVEIITAGSEWDEDKYELGGKVTNLGLLDGLSAVGDLYRSCDISFSFMLSKHPSYQPFELMASGVAYVTNTNEHNVWFLKDNINALVTEPSPSLVYESVCRLVDDPNLRQRIAKGGLESLPATTWKEVSEDIWSKILALAKK